jgi:glucose-1-phosphate cytidylyltransferase
MKTVLLAGGLGTRLREETEFLPKPMVPIGGKPILWHIMKNYSHRGFNEFIVCAGYKGEVIKEYFHNFLVKNLDFTVHIGANPRIISHGEVPEEWKVTVIDTGQTTLTGGRLFKVRDHIDSETFMCTYGDGLSNVKIQELIDFHFKHGKIATLTAVRPPSRFGVVNLGNNGLVESFQEKPQMDSWINGGYFVFNKKIFDYLDEDIVLEEQPLRRLANENQLMAFQHHGFWQPMDTFREMTLLNELWGSNDAPWKVW